MNNLFKRVVSLSIVSALVMSASTAALAAETNDTAGTLVNNSANDSINTRQTDENGIFTIDMGDIPAGVKDLDIDDIPDEHKFRFMEEANDEIVFSQNDAILKRGIRNSSGLPEAVDNSTNENSIYFPPIGDQGYIGSCVAWGTTYYSFTYMLNKARGIPTTPETTYSPMWTYNLCNCGVDGGTTDDQAFDILMKMGAAPITEVPPETNPEIASNYLSWHAEDDIWEHAAHNRLTDYYYFTSVYYNDGRMQESTTPVPDFGTPITDPDDSDLHAIKTALCNGDILPITTFIGNWQCISIKSTDDPNVDNTHVNEVAAIECYGNYGGHEMTLVGYNDNIWVDINNNDQVDSGEMGAFKVANSWGIRDDENEGFYWVAYDALNTVSAVENYASSEGRLCILNTVAKLIVEDKDHSSNAFIKYTFNSEKRYDTYLRITATEKDGGNAVYSGTAFPYSCGSYSDYAWFWDTYTNYNGTVGPCDGYMYYDLNNIIPDITPSDLSCYNWEINVTDFEGNSPLLVKELKFTDSSTGAQYDILDGAQDTIDHTTYTYTEESVNLNNNLGCSLSVNPKAAAAPSFMTISAAAKNGTAPYEYYCEVKDEDDNITVLSDWCSSSTFIHTVAANKSGNYKYIVKVRDADGNTVTKSRLCYVAPVTLEGIDTGDSNEASIGDLVVLKPIGTLNANLLKTSDVVYTITKNGVANSCEAKNTTDFSIDFTPDAGGLYEIKCTVSYNGATLAEVSKNFFVIGGNSPDPDSITIYYKGYSHPNIHYCVENGHWTSVPGVAMNADTSVSGYTHSYTIDLGSNASYAKVCFNDGHGNWDSRNGANYRFEKGTYTFKNGTIKKLETGLKVSLSLPGNVLQLFDTMPFSANAEGGTAPYFYKFEERQEGTDVYLLNEFSSDNTSKEFCGGPPHTFQYDKTIIVTVLDSEGNVAQASEVISCRSQDISVKADKTNIAPGDTVQLSLYSEYPLYNLHADNYYVYSDEVLVECITANSDGTATWTPTEEGGYTISARILTEDGFTAGTALGTFGVRSQPANAVTIYYKGYSHPNIHYQVGNGHWTSVPGVAMEATNEVSGCTHKYTIDLGNASYANVCFNDGHGNWDSRNGANYRFTQGTYKYSNGKITAM